MKKESIIALLSIIFSIMLLICWSKELPYLYFQFIRVIGILTFALAAYANDQRDNKAFMIIFSLSVIIIQPFIKFPLGRFYWNVLDTIWAVLLISNAIWLLRTNKV